MVIFKSKRMHRDDFQELQMIITKLIQDMFVQVYAPALRAEVQILKGELEDLRLLKELRQRQVKQFGKSLIEELLPIQIEINKKQ